MAGTKGRVLRYMYKLKKEGLQDAFGDAFKADLTASKHHGYPVQAHHRISCSVIQSHPIKQLAIDSGYDINNGNNCIFLPAKFGHMMIDHLQRHRGGHWKTYYRYVEKKLDNIYKNCSDKKPCENDDDKEDILDYLKQIENKIGNDLKNRDEWLYEWSENLYNEDYREESPGNLMLDVRGPGSNDGLAWAVKYKKGNPRRKHDVEGKIREEWYKVLGFPIPANVDY